MQGQLATKEINIGAFSQDNPNTVISQEIPFVAKPATRQQSPSRQYALINIPIAQPRIYADSSAFRSDRNQINIDCTVKYRLKYAIPAPDRDELKGFHQRKITDICVTYRTGSWAQSSCSQ